jgi:polyisoprenoid-binding protein YceI
MIFQRATTFRRLASATLLAVALSVSNAAFAAQTYVFDKDHTQIRFSWTHFGVSKMSGMLLDYQGALNIDEAAPENAKLEFTGKTDSIWTHTPKLTDHLKGPDFFGAAKFPEIAFKSTKIEKTGEKTAKITGDLTIHGVTRPVTLDAELVFGGKHPMTQKPALGFQATTTIKRSEFDVGKYVPAVSDEVEITINTEMTPEG